MNKDDARLLIALVNVLRYEIRATNSELSGQQRQSFRAKADEYIEIAMKAAK